MNLIKKESLINVPEIQNIIRETHKDFMERYAPQIDKVAADHKLLSDIIYTRLYRILICFKEEGVIDDIILEKQTPYKKICIKKNGYDNYVHVVTNGLSIIFEGFNASANDFFTDIMFIKKRFDDVHNDDYDWTEFSKELIDYIHNTIYFRKEAVETKIGAMFEDPSSK